MDRTAFSDRCAVKQGAFRLVDVYIGQAGATFERRASDFRDTVWNRDTGEASVIFERPVSD